MGYTRKKIIKKGFDEKEYSKYFHRNQTEYIRKRLRIVKSYYGGLEFEDLSNKYGVHHQTCRSYIKMYLLGGFKELCKRIERPQPSKLTKEQEVQLKDKILNSHPTEEDLEGNIWTGELIRAYIKKSFEVDYSSGVYDLLKRLNLTHQRAHQDYGNAKEEEQMKFIQDIENTLLKSDEKTAVVKFDEFSVSERPTAYYGWAEKNTRPKVITNEKKEND